MNPASGAHDKAKAADADKPLTLTLLNEDGSETVQETTGDSGVRNPLLAAVAATVAAATPAATAATPASSSWQEGLNYTRLLPAQPTAVPAGQVEVLEFFWYACPHCYALEPMVESWLKTKPAYISFSRVPVQWNESHRSLARLYYTLDVLGKLNQLHAAVFKEIHVNNDSLIGSDPDNAAQAESVQLAFVKKFGISADAFQNTYHGMSVDTKLRDADESVQRYRVSGVPTFVVNGKFITDVGMAGSADRLLALIADLAAQEQKH